MTDEDQTKPAATVPSAAGKARRVLEDARLAAALRANLARRKQQTRVRAAGDGDGPAGGIGQPEHAIEPER
jgi:hypothetical protein